LLQLSHLTRAHPSLKLLRVVKSVSCHRPSFLRSFGKTIYIGLARHTVFEVAISESARKVEFPIDSVLLALLQDNPSAIYNLHELLLIAQIVSSSQGRYLTLPVDPE
jgi:hypothetical protein